MMTKSNFLYFLLLLFSIISCSQKQEKKEEVENTVLINGLVPEVVLYHADSVAKIEAKCITASLDTLEKPIINQLLRPKKLSPHNKSIKLPKPGSTEIKKPVLALVPGKENIAKPGKIKILPKKIVCKQPKPKPTFPFRYTEQTNRNIQYFDVSLGMTSSYIYTILEDSRGNLWFGTYESGVSCYDGKTIRKYSIDEGLSGKRVNDIIEDKKGNLWIGTEDGGISKYDGTNFYHITKNEGLISNSIFSLFEDSKGNIWIGCDSGAVMFNGKHFISYTEKEGLFKNIASICEDKKGNIWFASYGGGIICWDNKQFMHFKEQNGLCRNYVFSIISDTNGNIWAGTINGADKFDGKKFEHYTVNEGLGHNFIRYLKEDQRGNIWFGTYGGGLSCFISGSIYNIDINDGLTSSRIRCIEEDDNGNIWLGTITGGICKYSPDGIYHLTKRDSLPSESIYPIIERKNGEIWVGTYMGGVCKFTKDTIERYNATEGFPAPIVWSIFEDSKQHLWFGLAERGLIKYDGKHFIKHFKNNGLYGKSVEFLYGDSHAKIWIVSFGSLSCLDENNSKYYSDFKGITDDVKTIYEDTKHKLWIGTSKNGLYRYDGKYFYNYSAASGLKNDEISAIFEDSNGYLWIGFGNKGLCRFDNEKFLYISVNEGLNNNFIRGISEDDRKNIWVATNEGINILKPDSSNNGKIKEYTIHSITMQDGLKGLDLRSILIDKKNTLWAGTGKCLTTIDLNKYSFASKRPRLHMQNLNINRQFIDYARVFDTSYLNTIPFGAFLENAFDSVSGFYNYPIGLKLPYHLNHLTFNLSAIDWYSPHKIKYQYKIIGIDKNWSDLTNDGVAEYRNIPPGHHTFVARATGAANQWSEEFNYSFTILPPWWWTWWAYSIYVIILVLLILTYRKYLIKREQEKSKFRIKEIELKKIKELDEHKSRFFANISHEFRTPLSLILGTIDEMDEFDLMTNEYRKPLSLMKSNSERLYRLVNQLLEFSKLDEGKMKLRLSKGNICESIKYIKASYESIAERKRIKFLFSEPEKTDIILWDQEKLEMIVHNLLSNAFRYTPEYGKVTFRYDIISPTEKINDFIYDGKLLLIEIADTGHGIEENKLEKLFIRFEKFADENKLYREGMGIGLALTKELIDFQNGYMKVESELNKGSVFKVYLPCDYEGFSNIGIIEYENGDYSSVKTETYESLSLNPVSSEIKQQQLTGDTTKLRTVLIAEDNQDMLQFLERKLSVNYKVELVSNGNMAWSKTLNILPDLIVTDLMMPELDGMELCRLIKEDERTSHIPVIILTARATVENRITGFKTGADDYLEKPFKVEELLARVGNLIIQREKLKNKYIKLIGFDTETIQATGMEEQFLQKALSEVENNLLSTDWNVDKFSESMNMSHSQLFRKLKALTGMSVTDFILSVRLNKAAKMLERNAGTVAEIAFRVGFNDSSYFAKCFKKKYKISPRAYVLRFKNL